MADSDGVRAQSTVLMGNTGGRSPETPLNQKKRFLAVIGVITGVSILIGGLHYITTKNNDTCYPKVAVAADAGNCSQVGRDILLLKNGSAVDAAIATLLCVGLYNPQNMGIGGGVVFTIYDASTGKVETIDARETAPQKSSANMFDKDPQKTESVTGGLSIAVPGLLRGFMMAHKRHGRLEWKDLFQPSIKMARKGVIIGKAMAEALSETSVMIENSTTWCDVFCDSNNKTLKENDMIKLLKLADTYELIANEGPDVFYTGSLSQKIVKDIQAEGGIITSEDLRDYEPRVHEYALNFTMRNYTFHVPSAPFSGPVLAMILKILDGYNFTHNSLQTDERKILTYHRMIEAFRFTYARKSELGDPQFVKITDIIENMTSDETARNIRSKIDDTTTKPDSYYGKDISPPYDSGTSHLSIIAEDGSAVSVTSSINDLFGSMVMSPTTGIIFNNQMKDFSRTEQGKNINMNNLIQPGKRPLSSMCPTIIMDNSQPKHKRVKMVVGASGWTKIPSAIAQVVLNKLYFDYTLKKSVDEPRFHNGWKPNVTEVEEKFDKSMSEGLRKKNHDIHQLLGGDYLGEVQVAVRQGDRICAECDFREGGSPAGY
ncbi:glutathione hydrolase 1 proenzyme-like isoform X1 [Triplophysa dalaica]|uniref:glutathione hydrolase 1 proenzyme-like isoform X1 n=1 Tax=Triplophysa dalaica TaxID=1582913 RepID=UPI0024DF81F0|nr:glutathione hydrolase 1 proenzyme-like isoform X1 [Triplophysa dalaica]XP_056624608.1 glutathione hydrolase 1 proenzyme-like isoform X1 [Triplophysa dalaica]